MSETLRLVALPAQPDFEPNEMFVTREQLAKHFGFSVRWVDNQVAAGLPHYRIGKSVRFQISSAARWLVTIPNL